MISVEELRKIQDEKFPNHIKNEEESKPFYTSRFKVAVGKYTELLCNEIEASIERAQTTDKPFIFLDHTKLIEELDGFAYTSFLYGFWNRKTKRFDPWIFKNVNEKKPLDVVRDKLKPLGYTLKNVSRDRKLILKLCW